MGCSREKSESQMKKERGLMDVVFSWSISDVLNNNLYKNKVSKIPKTFSSTDGYLKSFILPLLEETRSDLQSNVTTLSSAPVREVYDVKGSQYFKPPKGLFYEIILERPKENDNREGLLYSPQGGDLIALTERRPKCIDDLNTPRRPYLIALVQEGSDEDSHRISVLSANYIEFKKGKSEEEKRRNKLFIVYISNMTTNVRIWAALNSDQQHIKIIKNVLHSDDSDGSNCAQCTSQRIGSTEFSRKIIRSFKLDDSQESAILDVIALRECHHQNTVKLIWGPPGTGKTKTVGSLLFALLKLKCRTLTCAPTNVAVVGVASRLMSFVKNNLENYPYGLGDIVLFGNSKRMKIDEHEGLSDIFLDNRVAILKKCFAPLTGWKSSLESMMCLLEDPELQYGIYLKEIERNKCDDDDEKINKKDEVNGGKFEVLKQVVIKELKEDESVKRVILTLNEFFVLKFNLFYDILMLYIPSLYTHLPTCFITIEVMKIMKKASDLLKTFGTLVKEILDANSGIRAVLDNNKLCLVRSECVEFLKILQGKFSLPTCLNIGSLCLINTCLIFCTASSSAKLHTEGNKDIELLVIDEAAQLKECESAVPLQLPGLRHAVLVGDERQLPAMVQSQICEKAMYGRSLFERLVLLGNTKHLLNTQYRMHPSISQFPSREFYGNKIMDGQNVKLRSYEKCFLEGKMFGPFSFINVNQWKEDQDNGFSRKNLLEVAVVADLVASLSKESRAKKQKVSVGCISPYNAQVFAIKDKLGNLYSSDPNSEFSVKVNSVDGFQGSEEDVIIISTVRSNGNGSIGFLSNIQRTNVVLTRARYCLWVLGNEATLTNSGSVWKKLVIDAKKRNCFHNADEDKNLDKAIKCALLELGQIGTLFNTDSVLFKDLKWKVCFCDDFVKSMTRNKDMNIRNDVVSLITKLASGWRREEEIVSDVSGTCSMLMEQYNVNGEFILVWTVDILKENSKCIQVLKIWEILPRSKILEFANNLKLLFGNYTVNVTNRCQVKQLEGNLVVPVTWPVDSNVNDDPSSSLASKFSGLSLKNEGKSNASSWSTASIKNITSWLPSESVLENCELMGFEYYKDIGQTVEHCFQLLNAVLKYYNVEKRAFVFDEITLVYGLEDVFFLTGLPIGGKPVTGSVENPVDQFTNGFKEAFVNENGELDSELLKMGLNGDKHISVKWLKDNFETKGNKLGSVHEKEHVRAYMLYCIINFIIPQPKSGAISPKYLPLLENISEINKYAWGAASLASLHVELASLKNTIGTGGRKTVAAQVYPLLLFFFERIPTLLDAFLPDNPKRRQAVEKISTPAGDFPLMAGWVRALGSKMSKPKLDFERRLSELTEEQVVFQPYKRVCVPDNYKMHNMCWKGCRIPLFCFEKVVYHRPDLAYLQFGLTSSDVERLKLKEMINIKNMLQQRTERQRLRDA